MHTEDTVEISLEKALSEYSKIPGGGKITLDKDEETGLATVTIEHERRRNAISAPMVVMLAEAINELEEWKSGKGLIIWGGPNTFSSGVDLDTVRHLIAAGPSGGGCFSFVMHDILTRLLNMPLISVAVINGRALGGGAELATACDFRLMAEGSDIHFVHKTMGVTTGWGGGPRLVKQIGHTLALEMLVGGRKLMADEALNVGYSSATLTRGSSALEEARKWLLKTVEGKPEVVRAMKQLVTASRQSTMEQSLVVERHLFAGLFGGPAQLEALHKNIKH